MVPRVILFFVILLVEQCLCSSHVLNIPSAEPEFIRELSSSTSDHKSSSTEEPSGRSFASVKDLQASETFPSIGYAKYAFNGLFGPGYPPIGLVGGFGLNYYNPYYYGGHLGFRGHSGFHYGHHHQHHGYFGSGFGYGNGLLPSSFGFGLHLD